MNASWRGCLGAALLAACGACAAQDGRWEGRAEASGQAVTVILDVVGRGATPGALITLPGRSVQRVPLTTEWRDGVLRARAAPADGAAEADALRVELQLAADGRAFVGTLHQGGHRAALHLTRTGAAPAVDAIPSAPIPSAAFGVWRGRYDMGFGPREATLRLATAGASMTVVGRRTTEIAFDFALQRGALLMLRSSAADLSLEAPAAGAARGTLVATLRQGPFEAVFELQREGAR